MINEHRRTVRVVKKNGKNRELKGFQRRGVVGGEVGEAPVDWDK